MEHRIVYFELNGQPREVLIKDENVKATVQAKVKGDPKNDNIFQQQCLVR